MNRVVGVVRDGNVYEPVGVCKCWRQMQQCTLMSTLQVYFFLHALVKSEQRTWECKLQMWPSFATAIIKVSEIVATATQWESRIGHGDTLSRGCGHGNTRETRP